MAPRLNELPADLLLRVLDHLPQPSQLEVTLATSFHIQTLAARHFICKHFD
jgi:hypothetical protein